MNEWLVDRLEAIPGKNQSGLAKALNVDRSAVTLMIKGLRSVKASEIPIIARYLELDESAVLSLISGVDLVDTPLAPPAAHIDDFISIPRYDAALSAGPGSIVDPNAEPLGRYFFEAQWLAALTRATGDQLAVVRVDGDSMEPALSDGDWVLIDRTQTRINRPGVYAIQVGDTAWIKRITLNLRARLVQVISDNPVYPMQELEEGELSIIGRAIWIVGRKI